MSRHKFHLGSRLTFWGNPTGSSFSGRPCAVTRLLPDLEPEPTYWIKSASEPFQRVVSEGSLTLTEASPEPGHSRADRAPDAVAPRPSWEALLRPIPRPIA
jgi:hypothetical protein